MNKQNITLNIAHNVLNKQTNILYYRHGSFFDYLLQDIPANIFDYNGISNYYYDFYICNDFLSYHSSIRSAMIEKHLSPVLFLHSNPPTQFKKEDISLAHQTIAQTPVLFFNETVAKAWKFNNPNVIEYGLPDIKLSNKHNKPILILNLSNNPEITNIYNYIKNHFKDCDELNHLPPSTSIVDITNLINQYNVCLSFTSNINTLIAASCGCQCLTNIDCATNGLIHTITDYSTIIMQIKNLLTNNISEDERENHASKLKNQYKYDIFMENMSNTLSILKKEFFVL